MAFIPSSGSVVAFQSDPTKLVATVSVVGVLPVQVQSSIAAVIIGGSIAASFTPPANQSVSGMVGASIIGLPPFIAASMLSYPGIVSTANSTSTPVTSTLSFTGTGEEWKDFGSIVINVFTDAPSATDGLSIQQSSNNTNWDIQDTYTISSMIAGQGKTFQVQPAARFGRIVYTQGAVNSGAFRLQTIYHPQLVKPTSQRPSDNYTNETDTEQVQTFPQVFNGTNWDRLRGNSSIGALVSTGSSSIITRQSGTVITSLVSTVPSSVIVGASIFGQLPAGTAVLGSIISYQGLPSWNVSGSVIGFQGGTQVTSLVSTVPSSVIVGSSIFGQLPAGTAMLGSVVAYQGVTPWIIAPSSGSVAVNGSVVAFPGVNPWPVVGIGSVITIFQSSSILAVPVGSVITVLQSPSIVGTYSEDATHTSADKGIFALGVRNETMTSITSADLDYSPMAVGPLGEMLVANSPITKWIYGTTSIVSGPSVALFAAQGASIFSNMTGLNIVNPSANNLTGTLSTGAGAASVLVYFTAPANGGSNMIFPNPLRSRDNTAILASISGIGSVYLSAQGFISKL